MKTYKAITGITISGKYFMNYRFFDGDEEVGSTDISIDEDTYDYIAAGHWESDFCDTVDGKELEHTETDGEYHHGTWK